MAGRHLELDSEKEAVLFSRITLVIVFAVDRVQLLQRVDIDVVCIALLCVRRQGGVDWLWRGKDRGKELFLRDASTENLFVQPWGGRLQ